MCERDDSRRDVTRNAFSEQSVSGRRFELLTLFIQCSTVSCRDQDGDESINSTVHRCRCSLFSVLMIVGRYSGCNYKIFIFGGMTQ